MAWTVLAVARRKNLCRLGGPHCCGVDGARCRSPDGFICRLGGPHCCGVDGARYRSPEGSLAPKYMGRTVRTVSFKDMIGQYGDGARFLVYFFSITVD